MQVLIRQARIVDPQSEWNNKVADLLLADGVVKQIANHIDQQGGTVIEGTDICVSPGWVDAFADYREPGYEHKETIVSGLSSAAAGGFTRVLIVPNTQPTLSSKAAIGYVQQRATGHAAVLHPMGSVSQNIEGKDLAEMLDMHAHGAVAFTDGWKSLQSSGLMLKALEYVKAFKGLIVQMPVDAALSAGGLMHEGPLSTLLGMPGIPALAETLMVHRDIELLRYTQSRLHITGISSAASVAMIRAAKKEGLDITCSVTPYHLALNDEALTGYDSLYKVSPPLRSEADRVALIEGLKDGTIDCIASHHRPQEWDAKAREFEYASDGMNVQELAFNIVYDAIGDMVPLETIIKALSVNPRKIFGLPAAHIHQNNKVELTIFTTAQSYTLRREAVRSLSHNDPFIGKELKGRVLGIAGHHQTIFNK